MKAIVGSFERGRSQSSEEWLKSTLVLLRFRSTAESLKTEIDVVANGAEHRRIGVGRRLIAAWFVRACSMADCQ